MQRERVRWIEYTHSHTVIQTNTKGLETALCSVIVDGFLMKSGAGNGFSLNIRIQNSSEICSNCFCVIVIFFHKKLEFQRYYD